MLAALLVLLSTIEPKPVQSSADRKKPKAGMVMEEEDNQEKNPESKKAVT